MNTHPQHADAVWPGPDSRYRKLPLFGPVIDEAVAWLRQEGYTDATVRGYFKCLGQLVRWLQQRCGPRLERLTQGDLDAAYAGFHRRAPGLAGSVRTWARFLRGQRRIRECPQTPRTPSELELARFSAHLRRTRALAASTVTGHESRLRGFLQFLKYDQVPGGLRTLSLPRVEAFIRHAARTNNRFSLQHVVASLRSLLRYQHARGVLRPPLHQRIDTPRTYRLEQLPRALPWDRVVALLRSIDHSNPAGRRDFVLLLLLFNTGARVSEVVGLLATDLRLQAPASVLLRGKGRKERTCPLWPETANALRDHLEEHARAPHEPRPIFLDHRGQPLTRFGVRLILRRRVHAAAVHEPSLRGKRLHPHSLRHTAAIHLLRSGVDLSTIAHWLGHASVTTTNKYLALDLASRREALAKAKPLLPLRRKPGSWRVNGDLIRWLESL